MRGTPADRKVEDAGFSAAGMGNSPFYKIKLSSIVVDVECDCENEKTAYSWDIHGIFMSKWVQFCAAISSDAGRVPNSRPRQAGEVFSILQNETIFFSGRRRIRPGDRKRCRVV